MTPAEAALRKALAHAYREELNETLPETIAGWPADSELGRVRDLLAAPPHGKDAGEEAQPLPKSLRAAHARIEHLESQRNSALQATARMVAQRDALQAELTKENERAYDMEERIKALQARLTDTETELDGLKTNRYALAGELENLQAEHAVTEARLTEAKTLISDFQEDTQIRAQEYEEVRTLSLSRAARLTEAEGLLLRARNALEFGKVWSQVSTIDAFLKEGGK